MDFFLLNGPIAVNCCSSISTLNILLLLNYGIICQKPHNSFFSETHFIAGIDRHGHSAHRSNVSKSYTNRSDKFQLSNLICR